MMHKGTTIEWCNEGGEEEYITDETETENVKTRGQEEGRTKMDDLYSISSLETTQF